MVFTVRRFGNRTGKHAMVRDGSHRFGRKIRTLGAENGYAQNPGQTGLTSALYQ